MSKSFDEKLKERLENLTAQPKDGAKKALFDKLSDQGDAGIGYAPYHYFAGVLLLLSLFMIGRLQPHQDFPVNAGLNEMTIGQEPGTNYLSNDSVEQKVEATTTKIIENQADKEVVDTQPHKDDRVRIGEDDKLPVADYPSTKTTQAYHESGALVKLGIAVSRIPARRFHIAPSHRDQPIYIAPEKSKFIHPYIEAGAFFLYNRLKPNLEDDIYIGDYDSPFGMSLSRIGAAAHVGIERSWSERFATRLGLVFNNYNQSFSFNVRGVKPDSVIVSDEYVEPVFDTKTVEINKRVSTLGLRVQTIWNFPSEYNSLFAAFEYHRRVSNGPEFDYDNKTYSLSSPNQYLVEFGIRKKLLDQPGGLFFIQPALRYAVTKFNDEGILSVKPFSAGVSLNYSLK